MHILTTNINGNPNLGLVGDCNNDYCLVGKEVPESRAEKIGQALKVPVHRINICGTSLLGVFLAGNSKMLLVPHIAFDDEIEELNKLGIKHTIIKTDLTALGNNLLCNDKGCLANPDFSANVKKQIRQALDVTLHPGVIADLNIVGSLAVLNSKGCLVHQDITKAEEKEIKGLLGLNCITGTVNMGNPFIKSGVLCNDKGFVIGDQSGGPEITNADEALGFINL